MSTPTTSTCSGQSLREPCFRWVMWDRKARSYSALRDINQATPGPAVDLQQRRPFNAIFPQFAGIYQLEASSNSNYNALQVVLRRRLSKGLTVFASHVWSHSIDDASNGICSCTAGVSLPQNSFDTRAEKAASIFDQRQHFTANFVYDLDRRRACAEQVAETADRRLAVERHLYPGQRTSRSLRSGTARPPAAAAKPATTGPTWWAIRTMGPRSGTPGSTPRLLRRRPWERLATPDATP